MNFIPQMSPIYWLFISISCYLNFMMMMILVNTVFFKVKVYKLKFYMIKWNWLW